MRAAIKPADGAQPHHGDLHRPPRHVRIRVVNRNLLDERQARPPFFCKIARSFVFARSPRRPAVLGFSRLRHRRRAAGRRRRAQGADERPPDARRHRRRRPGAGLAHRPRGPVDRRPGRSHRDEQVGRVRPLRLARGTADLGRPRVPRQVRGRGVPAVDGGGARPAAPAGAVRPLAEARLGRDRLGLHLHQRRGRVRRPARAGARRPGRHGQHLAAGARALDRRRRRRGPPAGRHRRPPAAVRDPRPDPRPAPRRPLPAPRRRRGPGPRRLRARARALDRARPYR